MRILTFTLLVLLFVNCSKDDKETTAESTAPPLASWQLNDDKIDGEVTGTKFSEATAEYAGPLIASWRLDDYKVDGEIAGVKFTIDSEGLVGQMASGDNTTPVEQIKACMKSVKMEFKKGTFKLYPSSTNSLCKQLEEKSGGYTADGKKITFKESFDFIFLEGVPVKEADYTIADNVLTLTIDSEYNGIEANFKVTFNKE